MFRSIVVVLTAGLTVIGLSISPEGVTEAASRTVQTTTPWVGAHAGCDDTCTTDPATVWNETNRLIGGGRLSYSRDFNPTIPPVGKESWRKVPSPYHFYSVKPPADNINGFIVGRYDDALRAVIRALPAGTKVTMYHEPEDNMSGQTFAALLGHFRTVVKSVRPEIPVWYVAMAYQWRTNSKGHVGTNQGWIDAAKTADAVGVDVYAPARYFKSLADDAGFTRWWNEIKVPSGKADWGIIERGISNENGAAARVKILDNDWAFAKSHGLRIFLYWDTGGDELTGPQEAAAYRSIAAQGATP
jgi:hypothetical protein